MKKSFATLLIRVNVDSVQEYENIIRNMCKYDICNKFDFLCFNDKEVLINGDCECINIDKNEYEVNCVKEILD